MSEPLTLLRLLEESGHRVIIYDIGRRVGEVPRRTFERFESASEPYPLPMQRKAWFALVQAGETDDVEPVIWFLHLSLDEQGLLIPAQRDYLLDRLLESARAGRRGDNPQNLLQDNPHAFTPRQDRMALFHARLGTDLNREPSRFYPHALDYFSGNLGWDQWEFVGYQGIADVACRHDGTPLDAAVPHLPAEPLVALCHCLESQAVSAALQSALLARLASESSTTVPDAGIVSALLRGVSRRADDAEVRRAIAELMEKPLGADVEILAAIAGRCWEALSDPPLLRRFLERLADNSHGQPAFEHCVTDLLSLPGTSADVRRALQAEDRGDAVRTAFERMTAALEAGSPRG
jgi:hypothetical protein